MVSHSNSFLSSVARGFHLAYLSVLFSLSFVLLSAKGGSMEPQESPPLHGQTESLAAPVWILGSVVTGDIHDSLALQSARVGGVTCETSCGSGFSDLINQGINIITNKNPGVQLMP